MKLRANTNNHLIFQQKISEQINFCIYSQMPTLENLYFLKQTHSTIIWNIDDVKKQWPQPLEGDGFFFENYKDHKSNSNYKLSIVTADCLPVLLLSENSLAFIHAGWRGIASGILESEDIKKLNPTMVFIGPAIHKCCYQVQNDYVLEFGDKGIFNYLPSGIFMDLIATATQILEKQFPKCQILESHICTCCDANFHSYRSNKTAMRNWNTVDIKLH